MIIVSAAFLTAAITIACRMGRTIETGRLVPGIRREPLLLQDEDRKGNDRSGALVQFDGNA